MKTRVIFSFDIDEAECDIKDIKYILSDTLISNLYPATKIKLQTIAEDPDAILEIVPDPEMNQFVRER